MPLSMSDRIWNRACLEQGGSNPMQGDLALTAMLLSHNQAMNSGLLDVIERFSETEVVQAVAGYRYFGLDDAAAVVELVAKEISFLDQQNPDAAEAFERDADDRYGAVVPGDSVLVHKFERKYQEQPEAFAPDG